MDISDLSKRLLQAMQMGVTIRHHNDGHRWLVPFERNASTCELNEPHFYNLMRNAGIVYSEKVYGGAYEALNYIDYLLGLANTPTLLDQFNDSTGYGSSDCHPFDAFGDTEVPDEQTLEMFKEYATKP